MDFYTDGIAGCFWNLISVLCAYVGQFAGIHAWNIPHECILWGSVILCDIVGAIVYVVTRILLGYGFSPYLSTYYILMSMLLALAMCMPEGEVRLYFVLPIRMKWMLIFELVYLGYQVVRIFSIGIASYGTGMGILVGVLNCVQIVVPVLNMFWFSMP